jgi:hypothetical protein
VRLQKREPECGDEEGAPAGGIFHSLAIRPGPAPINRVPFIEELPLLYRSDA